jgi:hypothetical protein
MAFGQPLEGGHGLGAQLGVTAGKVADIYTSLLGQVVGVTGHEVGVDRALHVLRNID